MKKRNLIKAAVGATAALIVAAIANKAIATDLGAMMAVISRPVKDYAAWRVIYDSAEPIRQKAGVTASPSATIAVAV